MTMHDHVHMLLSSYSHKLIGKRFSVLKLQFRHMLLQWCRPYGTMCPLRHPVVCVIVS
jgi:hypothetical protein